MPVICANWVRNVLVAAAVVVLVGCATPEARDFRGRWKPLNQFSETTQAIPLHQGYVYQASPVDATLKGMLARWAKDSKLSLSYLHPNDYTLHMPVAGIRTYNIRSAVAELTAAYSGEGVLVSVEGSQIVVSQAQRDIGEASGQPSSMAD